MALGARVPRGRAYLPTKPPGDPNVTMTRGMRPSADPIPMPSNQPALRNLTVAITGASGSIFPRTLLDLLDRDERVGAVNLIVSDSGLRVMAEELEISGRNDVLPKLLGRASQKIHQQNNDDIGANVASGSYPTDAMMVLPCSMGTLARIANGMANQLIDAPPTSA